MAITSLAGNATQGLDRGSTRIPHHPEVALRLPPANGLDPSGIDQKTQGQSPRFVKQLTEPIRHQRPNGFESFSPSLGISNIRRE